MTTCVRCGADLTVPPHSKLYWQGVPNAKDGQKGDLCDPCHREWEAEFVPAEPELVRCNYLCDKPSCYERCIKPEGHDGYHTCPGPNAAQKARGGD